MCNDYVIYQATTAIGLDNQIGEVLQVDLEGPPGVTCELWENLRLAFAHLSSANGGQPNFNVSTTSYFIACTLNATTTPLHLSMQDGQITNTDSLPNDSNEAEPWTVWSSGNTTELVQMACTCVLPVLSIG